MYSEKCSASGWAGRRNIPAEHPQPFRSSPGAMPKMAMASESYIDDHWTCFLTLIFWCLFSTYHNNLWGRGLVIKQPLRDWHERSSGLTVATWGSMKLSYRMATLCAVSIGSPESPVWWAYPTGKRLSCETILHRFRYTQWWHDHLSHHVYKQYIPLNIIYTPSGKSK